MLILYIISFPLTQIRRENVNKASTWRSGNVADKPMTDSGGDNVINRVNSLRQTTRRHYVTLITTAAKQHDTHTCAYAHRLHNVNVCTKYTRNIIIIKKNKCVYVLFENTCIYIFEINKHRVKCNFYAFFGNI